MEEEHPVLPPLLHEPLSIFKSMDEIRPTQRFTDISRIPMKHFVLIFNNLPQIVRNEKGATLVEYGLMVLLIAVACVGGVTLFGGNLNVMFTNTAAAVMAAL
jgi:pilus assembly protein Flp/PilA